MRILVVLSVVVLATAITVGCYSPIPNEDVTDVVVTRQRLFSMTLSDIEGNKHAVGQPNAKAMLLLFTSHTCPIANAYVPRINRVHQEYSQRGIQIFVVQVDPGVELEQLRTHAEQYELQPPVIHDLDHTLVDRASATVTPQAVLFDRLGNIVYSGRIDDQYVDFGVKRREPSIHDLVNALDAFLEGEEVTPKTTQAVGCYIGDLKPSRIKK